MRSLLVSGSFLSLLTLLVIGMPVAFAMVATTLVYLLGRRDVPVPVVPRWHCWVRLRHSYPAAHHAQRGPVRGIPAEQRIV